MRSDEVARCEHGISAVWTLLYTCFVLTVEDWGFVTLAAYKAVDVKHRVASVCPSVTSSLSVRSTAA